MFNKENFLKELEALVNIDCGTYNPGGTAKIVDILAQRFTAMGFYVKKIDVGSKVGPLLVACNKENPNEYDALLIGHTDTVYKDGIAKNHQMRIEGNKVYGLGSIDMKSGLLLGIYAVETMPKELLDRLSLCFVFNPDEEISSIFSELEIEKLAKKARCALVLESSGEEGSIINKRKGIARYHVKFKGKAAHASTPEEGASAVKELARFITRLEEFYKPSLNTTFNISPISGGTVGNVVPEDAEMDFEIRYLDNDVYKHMKNRIAYFADNPIMEGVKIEIKELSFKPPLNNIKESKWIEDTVLEATAEVGQNLALATSGGGSDGNYISSIGVPTMDGLGPLGAYWHNENLECLFIDSVSPKIDLLQRILEKLIK